MRKVKKTISLGACHRKDDKETGGGGGGAEDKSIQKSIKDALTGNVHVIAGRAGGGKSHTI